MSVRVTLADRDNVTPAVVACPLCKRPLIKGDPRGQFTISCRDCHIVILVVEEPQLEQMERPP